MKFKNNKTKGKRKLKKSIIYLFIILLGIAIIDQFIKPDDIAIFRQELGLIENYKNDIMKKIDQLTNNI